MLLFVSKELALGYLLFSFLAALGVLQIVATYHRLVGLAFWQGGAGDSSLQRNVWGYALGSLLIAASATWFLVSQWKRIFAPGPAGAELTLLFGGGSLGALITSLTVSAALHRPRSAPGGSAQASEPLLAVGCAWGTLHLPDGPATPAPAVCLLTGPGMQQASLERLARHLAKAGLAALLVQADVESYAYPAIMSITPAAVSLLGKRPDVDPQRLGALGHDLGGDLVIRSAGADRSIKAVVALAPVLLDAPANLDLLLEMTYIPAIGWSRDRQRAELRRQLDAMSWVDKVPPRPLLLLYGADDRLVVPPPADRLAAVPSEAVTLRRVAGAGHMDLLDSPQALHLVVQWFKEHL